MTYIAHSDKYRPKNSCDIDYLVKREIEKEDFTSRIDKKVIKLDLPKGLYGFTYLFHGQMYINNALERSQDEETQLHEAIHTDNEYETRILTSHMLDINKSGIENKVKQLKEDEENNNYYQKAA